MKASLGLKMQILTQDFLRALIILKTLLLHKYLLPWECTGVSAV